MDDLIPQSEKTPPMLITYDRYDKLVELVSVPGPLAEIGVAWGGVVWSLAERFPDRTVYAYDTFCGLPDSMWQDGEFHRPGEFAASASCEEVLMAKPNIIIRKGLFPMTLGEEHGFAMVHLDCDFYRSTLFSILGIVPRLAPGGVLVLDDWDWPNCPGVKTAVEELKLPVEPTGARYQVMFRKPV